MAFKYAIALTGGIASGKSSVTTLLSLFGFRFIDADKIAHEMLDINAQNIASSFGEQFVVNGKVNRKALGVEIFASKEKRVKLEQLLHPLIFEEIKRQSIIQDEFKYPYIVDIPLFFETSRYPIEKSLVVYTPKQMQLSRLMNRDKLDEIQAIQRIESQMSIEEKRVKATYLIDNSKNLKWLQSECERVKEDILRDFGA
ncbi:MAG: dephospho-CoA kinase [Sulfurovum sp.]|nr:MAG: dephospho-CoA kinase [Sulfurovum sp.]